MNLKCVGCGHTIQSSDPHGWGYTPVSATTSKGDNIYCQRCFAVVHRNAEYYMSEDTVKSQESLTEMEKKYYQKIKQIKDVNALVILVIDVLDLHGGFIPNLDQHIGQNPVVILVNKADLFPKSVVLSRLRNKIRSAGKNQNLNVKEVLFISTKKEHNIEEAFKKIISYFNDYKINGNSCYVVGATSVGKSSFINAIMLKHHPEAKIIATSSQHQTTLDLIKIPLGRKKNKEMCYLIDTPGYVNYHNITAHLSFKSLKILNPSTFIKVRNFQLKEPQAILLGGLVKVMCYPQDGKNLNVAFYVSNQLYIHRTKLEKADSMLEKHQFELLVPPFNEAEKFRLGKMKQCHYEYHLESGTVDIAISGLGYIHLARPCGKIIIEVPHRVLVTESKDYL